MTEFDLVDIALNQGFAIAICCWLLWQKSKQEQKTILALNTICTTMNDMNRMIEEIERRWHYR